MKVARFVLSLVVCVAGIILLASAVQAQTCPVPANADVTTWHYDNCRTGWQQNESILTAAGSTAITQTNFGLVAQWNGTGERSMGRVFAQPLAVSGLPIVQGQYGQNCNNPCSLVLIGDENDMLWAYNAGSTSTVPVWSIDLALEAGGIAPIDCQTIVTPFAPCENGVLGDSVGATGTGVIDESNPNRPYL